MGIEKIQSSWHEHISRTDRETAEERALSERIAKNFSSLHAAIPKIDSLIDHAGEDPDATLNDRVRSRIQDVRRSLPIPMGNLGYSDNEGRSHGFVVVEILRDKTELAVTPKVKALNIHFYAGKSDGSETIVFDNAHWDVTDGFTDTAQIERINRDIAIVSELLDEQQA